MSNNNNNIVVTLTPVDWGPHYWYVMHTVPVAYNPTTDKKAVTAFYRSLVDVLPCGMCRDGFAAVLKELPIEDHLETPQQLAEWVQRAHNMVREKLGKPPMSRRDVLIMLRDMGAGAAANRQHDYVPYAILSGVAVLAALAVWIVLTRR